MPLGAFKSALFGASADTGTAVLLSTATASNDASIEFTLPTAYKQVKFGFYNVTPATDGANFTFQVNASGQSGYNETMTTTTFSTSHTENDASYDFGYSSTTDQAQGTSYQQLCWGIASDADGSGAGTMMLYNPSSTTYVKHFTSTNNYMYLDNRTVNSFVAGYINNTAVISEIAFKFSSGNVSSGTIKMWGIK